VHPAGAAIVIVVWTGQRGLILMPFVLRYARNAQRHLRSLRAFDRGLGFQNIDDHLLEEPDSKSQHRILLRPNPLATWELRVGVFRVFYEVDRQSSTVMILAIGYKEHNVLYIDD
jgi:mRNA-degrading endonuclease RelE of RelBE toxin-antitoxin system